MPPISLEFACGKLMYDQVTKKVTADKSKGLIRLDLVWIRIYFIKNKNEENEIKLQWINLSNNGEIEFERYLFKSDAVFEQVPGQKRVYLLKFQSDSDIFFFWMQFPDQSKDEGICKQFNSIIDSQFADMVQEEQKEQPIQQQRQQPAQINQQNNAFNQQLLQQVMSQMNNKGLLSLNEVLTQDFLKSIVDDEDYLNAILLHLPDDQKDPDFVRDNLISPQFQQAVEQLEFALRNQERVGVFASLELDTSILQQEFDGLEAFLKAIKKKAKQEEDQNQ